MKVTLMVPTCAWWNLTDTYTHKVKEKKWESERMKKLLFKNPSKKDPVPRQNKNGDPDPCKIATDLQHCLW